MNSDERTEVAMAIAIAQMTFPPQIEYNSTIGRMMETEPRQTVLGEVITCNTCLAYLDGFFRAPKTGFCPVCGVHLSTMKKRQERKARLIRHYEDGGAI